MNNEAQPLIDSIGFFGNLFECSLVIALGTSTLLVFFYLWKRDRLGCDEQAAEQMVNQDDLHIQQ